MLILPFVGDQLADKILWGLSISLVVAAIILFNLLFRNKSKNNKDRKITDLANIYASLNDITIKKAKQMFQHSVENKSVTQNDIAKIISLTLDNMVRKRRLTGIIRDHLKKFWDEEADFCKKFNDWIILDVAFAFRQTTKRKRKQLKQEHYKFNQYMKALRIYSKTYQQQENISNKSVDSQETTIEFSTVNE